jgi:hypothetical protein
MGSAAVAAVTRVPGLNALPAGAKSTTTTAAHGSTTTTTAGGHTTSPAHKGLLKAIGAESKIGSVHLDGKIQEDNAVIYLDLLVNADGEGGVTFIQDGFNLT